MWFPLMLSSWITISTIVSTLRAGSRVWYLLGHQGRIGRMDGPLITSSNSTNPIIYESTLGFRHAVSLAFQQQQQQQQQLPTIEKDKTKHFQFPPLLQHTKHGIQWWFHELQKITTTVSRHRRHLPSKHTQINKRKMNSKIEDDDENLDFQDSTSSIFDMSNHDSNSTKNTCGYKVTCFAPKVFAKLRQQFGISQKQFIQSILFSGPYISFQSNSKGAARSGGFFFFTSDGTYMIKTIKVQINESTKHYLFFGFTTCSHCFSSSFDFIFYYSISIIMVIFEYYIESRSCRIL